MDREVPPRSAGTRATNMTNLPEKQSAKGDRQT
jgi:hypothetical protein